MVYLKACINKKAWAQFETLYPYFYTYLLKMSSLWQIYNFRASMVPMVKENLPLL